MALRYDGSEPGTVPVRLTDCGCRFADPPTFGNLSTLLKWAEVRPCIYIQCYVYIRCILEMLEDLYMSALTEMLEDPSPCCAVLML